MKIVNRTRKTTVVQRLRIADSFFSRLKGLLGTKELPAGEALLISPCSDIHMIGMKYAIDVAFVSKTDQVLKTFVALAPWRLASCRGAAYVVEMPCGTLQASGTEAGDLLGVIDDNA